MHRLKGRLLWGLLKVVWHEGRAGVSITVTYHPHTGYRQTVDMRGASCCRARLRKYRQHQEHKEEGVSMAMSAIYRLRPLLDSSIVVLGSDDYGSGRDKPVDAVIVQPDY